MKLPHFLPLTSKYSPQRPVQLLAHFLNHRALQSPLVRWQSLTLLIQRSWPGSVDSTVGPAFA
jgi:hypothetical protein